MRRRALVAMGCGTVLAATAAIAWAAPATITNSGNSFSAPVFTHDAGTKATFTNVGLTTHNVISSTTGAGGQPLFQSGDVPGNTSAPVEGTQSIPAGDYGFFCSFHPGMTSTLRVTGTLPGSGGGGGGASSPGVVTPAERKKCKKFKGKKRKRCLRRARRR